MNNNSQNIRKTISNYTYDQNDLIGSGYSSKVYKGINTKINQVVAIKVISFQQLTTPISKSLLKNEIQVLSLIDHPNLMKIYETFETKNNRYLICEYCNEGDLAEILDSIQFTETQALDVFLQIAQGIKALHDKKIIHRDIKPANILKSNGYYKLADFGFAVIENQYESIIKKFNVGTPMYMAPETVQNNIYSEKSDIWALGIVLFQMIYHELPKFSKQENELTKKHLFLINKITNDTLTSLKTKELMLNMLNFDPEKRISISQVISNFSIQPKKIQTLSHQSIPYRSIKTSSISQELKQSRQQLDDQNNNQILQINSGDQVQNQLLFKQHQMFKSQEIMGQKNLDSKKVIKINQIAQFLEEKNSHNEQKDKTIDLKLQINQNNVFKDQQSLNVQTIKESYTQKIEIIPKPFQQSPIKYSNESRLKTQKSQELLDIQKKNQEIILYQQSKQQSQQQHQLQIQQIEQKEQDKITAIQQIPTTTTQILIKNIDNNSKYNGYSGEESDCIQHSHRNSTNDTIKNNQFSNCHQIIQETQKIIDSTQSLSKQSYTIQNNISPQQKKSHIRVVQSQQNLMPFKSSGVSLSKNSQDNKRNCYFQTNVFTQPRQFASQTQHIQNPITYDVNPNFQDDQKEFLSASIRPTYKFLLFLNNLLKQFDSIDTEDKQKCYFLIRKLLGIKATYIQKNCPANIQDNIQGWINSFLSFYSKVESVFYLTPDKQFEQYFNKDLSKFTGNFSQLLLDYLQKINIIKLQKDFQLLQEILQENLHQNNDSILFARRWVNEQL